MNFLPVEVCEHEASTGQGAECPPSVAAGVRFTAKVQHDGQGLEARIGTQRIKPRPEENPRIRSIFKIPFEPGQSLIFIA